MVLSFVSFFSVFFPFLKGVAKKCGFQMFPKDAMGFFEQVGVTQSLFQTLQSLRAIHYTQSRYRGFMLFIFHLFSWNAINCV